MNSSVQSWVNATLIETYRFYSHGKRLAQQQAEAESACSITLRHSDAAPKATGHKRRTRNNPCVISKNTEYNEADTFEPQII